MEWLWCLIDAFGLVNVCVRSAATFHDDDDDGDGDKHDDNDDDEDGLFG
jgi:hypothetical protein